MLVEGLYFVNVHTNEELVLRESGSIYHRRAGGRWYYFRHDGSRPVVITKSGHIKVAHTEREAPCPNGPPWLELENPYRVKGKATQ